MHNTQIGSNEENFYFLLHLFIHPSIHLLKSLIHACLFECFTFCASASADPRCPSLRICSSLTLSLPFSSRLSLLIIYDLKARPSHPRSPVSSECVCTRGREKYLYSTQFDKCFQRALAYFVIFFSLII